MKKFLVTGGAGFIGSNIVKTLLNEGHIVRVLDNFSTGNINNLKFLDTSNLEIMEGDITCYSDCCAAVKKFDCVLHQAAIPSVIKSVSLPLETNDANINGTLNLLIASKENNIKRFVFASSSAIYGNSPGFPRTESIVQMPLSPYAVQKMTCEHYLRVFYELYGLQTVSLRYFNVFGPNQNPNSEYSAVIPKFIKASLIGDKLTVYGDGEQSRDFTYVDNVVYGNLLAIKSHNAVGKSVNIACGEKLTLNQVIENLKGLVKNNIEVIYGDNRPGDVKHSWADISLAEELMGYSVNVGFGEGLRKTIEHISSKIH